MPRGYLRRGEKKYCLSQKKARGGHSKKDPLYKKPPRWGPYWYEARKPKLRQRGHRERQWMIDDETSTALEYDYSNTDLGYDYDDCDYLKEDNLPPVVVSCEGDIDQGTRTESLEAERSSVVERLQDPTPSECSYSLCGEDFSCQDVESFSILSVGAEDNDTVNSVASSLWEIVSEALPTNDSNARGRPQNHRGEQRGRRNMSCLEHKCYRWFPSYESNRTSRSAGSKTLCHLFGGEA